MIHILFFTENGNRWKEQDILKVYPNGFQGVFSEFLSESEGFQIEYAYQTENSCSLTKEMIEWADVILWWGHQLHDLVPEEIAESVASAVRSGKGIVFLHSAHMSKPFLKLLGTTGSLSWYESDKVKERLWTTMPAHEIAAGVPECVLIEHEEMYGEPFGIPNPDELVFMGWFNTGNIFRSGVCYYRDNGRIFYFQPGHETFPVYKQKEVQKIIKNAIRWANRENRNERVCRHMLPLEDI